MAQVISGKALLELIKEGKVIEEGNVENCDAIKYDFVLDSMLLKAHYGGALVYSSLKPIEQKRQL